MIESSAIPSDFIVGRDGGKVNTTKDNDMDKWEVFVSSRHEGFVESYDDENDARKTYEAYVGSDTTCMLTNNGKLIAHYARKEF